MPAAFRAAEVSATPLGPKSCEWLFALFSTVKPLDFNTDAAKSGGMRNAKQGGGDGEAVVCGVPDADGDGMTVGLPERGVADIGGVDDDGLGDGVGVGHLVAVEFVNVPSRFAKTIGAARALRTDAR